MALSASESALLTQTCENMNVAANTCREVLEMLRNLGNTGVVDIAAHNNTPGAHANDSTLAHVTTATSLGWLGLGTASYSGWGGQSSTPIHFRWDLDEEDNTMRSTDIVLQSKSQGGVLDYNVYYKNEIFLTDTNGSRVSFSDYTQSNLFNRQSFRIMFDVTDSEGKQLSSSIMSILGRSASWGDTQSVASSPYTNLCFNVANGLNSTVIALTIDSGGLIPGNANSLSLGNSSRTWKDAYLQNAVTVVSDRRMKKNVTAIGLEVVDFIKSLRPVSFKMSETSGQVERYNQDGEVKDVIPAIPGSRTHWGLIAQEVKEALDSAGIEDAALWCLADKDDPDSKQSLRYEELIAPMIKVIQQQQERIEALERRVA